MDELFDTDDVEAVVGDDDYITDLETLRDEDFTDRSHEDVLELHRARYVAEEARDRGDGGFADTVEDVRDDVFEPLERFDRKAGQEDFGAMTEREASFLHYPGPPHDFIEAAEAKGLERAQQKLGEQRFEDLYTAGDFSQEQLRLYAVGAGARELARQHYQQVRQRFAGNDEDFGFDYADADAYADAVAFNAALAAERWFEHNGDLVYGP